MDAAESLPNRQKSRGQRKDTRDDDGRRGELVTSAASSHVSLPSPTYRRLDYRDDRTDRWLEIFKDGDPKFGEEASSTAGLTVQMMGFGANVLVERSEANSSCLPLSWYAGIYTTCRTCTMSCRLPNAT